MRFVSLKAIAFGPFVDQELRFAPGVNVIWGPNESGKSSWHAALYAALCGTRRGRGPMRAEDREFQARHKPWIGGRWQVEGQIELADGRTIRLVQDLEGRVACRASMFSTGRDVSNEIVVGNDSPDGSRWLDLDRDAFLATACIRQADVLAVATDHEQLQRHLQRAADTRGTQGTAAEAIARLREFRRSNVGLEHTDRPLRQARIRVSQAGSGMREAHRRHEEEESALREIRRLTEVLQIEEARHRYGCAQRARRASERAAQRRDEVRRLSTEFPDGPPETVSPRNEMAAEIMMCLAEVNVLLPGFPDDHVTARELEVRLSQLPDFPGGDCAPDLQLLSLRNEVLRLSGTVEALEASRPEIPSDSPCAATSGHLRNLADILSQTPPTTTIGPSSSPGVSPTFRVWQFGVAVALSAGLLAGIAVHLGGGSWKVVAGASSTVGVATVFFLRLARRKEVARDAEQPSNAESTFGELAVHQRAARDECKRIGIHPVPAELRRLANEVDCVALAQAAFAGWESSLQDARSRLLEVEQELADSLRAKGIAPGGSFEACVERYQEQCRQNAEQASRAGQHDELQRRLEERRQVEKNQEDLLKRREGSRERMRRFAAELGFTGLSDEAAAKALQSWLEQHELDQQRRQERRARWERLAVLLDGRTVADVEEDAEALEREASELNQDNEMEPMQDGVISTDEVRLRQMADAIKARRSELDTLTGRVHEMSQRPGPSVPEAEEELAAANQELQRVLALDDTLLKTIEYLERAEESVHRSIAPVLVSSIESWLPRVTQGRYTNVQVDPSTLDIQIGQVGGQFHRANLHSQGTTEVVYLLLRVALAEHLVRQGESCPLVLDDVTVQCDRQRTYEVLRALLELSDRHQVIVFSQEDEVADWARKHLRNDLDQFVELRTLDSAS